jgi:hypothetical protein
MAIGSTDAMSQPFVNTNGAPAARANTAASRKITPKVSIASVERYGGTERRWQK